MQHVAVIGAGIAGLTAARDLVRAGLKTTVFEKSKGLGGRMATRRTSDFQFDHGAQYFRPDGENFRDQVADWIRTGVVAPWSGDRHVGIPGMTAPARDLASASTVVHGIAIGGLTRGLSGRWAGHDDTGLVDAQGNGSFDAVVLAVPVPQAIPLVVRAGLKLDGLASAQMAPCWALMIGAEQPIDIPGGLLRPDNSVIAWIADNSSNPGRAQSGASLVVHATPEWSRANLEQPPEAVAALLLRHVRHFIEVGPAPTYLAAHRWRFALVEQAIGQPCLWNAGERLGARGDWCLGPRVEAAFDSGAAMALAILSTR